MALDDVTTYKAGGYDTTKPANNVAAVAPVVVSPEQANERTVRQAAANALAANSAFLALGSPTNAQVVTQVQRLSRECNALIRVLLRQFDSTSDT